MRHKLRVVLLGLMLLAGLVGLQAKPADATTWTSTDWVMGRPMGNWYDTQFHVGATNGVWFLGGDLHAYLALPAHLLELGNNSCRGCNPFWSRYNWIEGTTDRFDLFSVKWSPLAGLDMALVDFGSIVSGGALPYTDKLMNWCDPGRSDQARCSTWIGQGSASNPHGVGSYYDTLGGFGPPPNAFVCKSGTVSGISCGTVSNTVLAQYNGYSYFAYEVFSGMDRCGVAKGDSGSPVYADQGNNQAYIVGVLTSSADNFVGTAGGCYSSGSAYGDNMAFVGVDQIQSVFGPFTGGSLTVVS